MKNATLGFRVHSGWAVAVALCGPLDSPLVIDRRRLELVKTFTYTFRQPYHTGEKMPKKDAAQFIAGVRSEASRLAISALRSMQTDLADQDYKLGRCALLLASGRGLPGLGPILSSPALIP